MVLAERTGNLSSIISTLGGLVLGWPGLFAAGAAAIGLMVYSSNSAEEKLLAMQTALRATRNDYISMAAEAQAAAKAVGAIPGFSGRDAHRSADDGRGAGFHRHLDAACGAAARRRRHGDRHGADVA